MTDRGSNLPRLHVVTDDLVLSASGWIDGARRVMEAGGQRLALHVRGSGIAARALVELVEALGEHARVTGARLFVNDRIDVALVAGVRDVHLRARSLSVVEARRLLGPEALLGVSCHGAAQVEAAVEEGADYVFVGNVFETPSHPDRPGLGTPGLEGAVVAAGRTPVFAIGGMNVERVSVALATGARGVAVLSGVWGASDPGSAVGEYISALSGQIER